MDKSAWENDYHPDLETMFLSDEDAEWVYSKFDLPRNVKNTCPTCFGDRTYEFLGETVECNCRLQLSLAKNYFNANIGDRYQRLDWSDYFGDEDALGVAKEYLSNHKLMVASGVNVFLCGSYGTGKTLLASLIAKELVKMKYSVYFATFSEMIEMFTAGWTDHSEKKTYEKRIVNSDVLVLDDVGQELRTKSRLEESTFDNALRRRVINSKPTIITANLNSDDLRSGYGEAIFALLMSQAVVHEFQDLEGRSAAGERTLEEIRLGWRRPIF